MVPVPLSASIIAQLMDTWLARGQWTHHQAWPGPSSPSVYRPGRAPLQRVPAKRYVGLGEPIQWPGPTALSGEAWRPRFTVEVCVGLARTIDGPSRPTPPPGPVILESEVSRRSDAKGLISHWTGVIIFTQMNFRCWRWHRWSLRRLSDEIIKYCYGFEK
jgi:hypothetical protein